jgi:hypothetical protein
MNVRQSTLSILTELLHKYYARRWEQRYLADRGNLKGFDDQYRHNDGLPNNDKYLSLLYKTSNIGDDIQTIAQLGFIPPDANIKWVRRDKIHEFNGDNRRCIMNGWFTHSPESWPPSENIRPVFVSFHISKPELASSKYKPFYKKHEPIGCRDLYTARILNDIGIDAVFTGCLTLTINNPNRNVERRGVIVCEAHREEDYLPSAPDLFNRLIPEKIKRQATYVHHGVRDRYAGHHIYKMSKAIKLLDMYSRAKIVITSRLHCALPCIAMGTPVVFLHKDWASDKRFDGYRDLINGYGPNSEQVRIDWDNPFSADPSAFKQRIAAFIRDNYLS